ncbi:unnamed protein product [Effrenium voratum]|uniref:Uncharacterized protein n=1 Tax=Effrenium voratum TaxID=2562239 RepID=A0AA36JFH5_9DINO|nr:unnamed protein product [Effrenium voratum]
MFFVKYLDQKQGEARASALDARLAGASWIRVVDQQQLLRARLEKFLQQRPSAQELLDRGILGREQRFAVAQQVLEELLRRRLQAQQKELERPGVAATLPPGAAELLQGQASLARLEELRALRSERQRGVQDAQRRWEEAAAECGRCGLGPTAPRLAQRLRAAVQGLERRREAEEQLAGVFQELEAFQQLLARRRTLEDIIAMVEQTDAAREAVFAFSETKAAPEMQKLLALCTKLPPRSRAIGLKRLRFLLEPLKRNLTQELLDQLRRSGRWPREPSATGGAAPGATQRALELCWKLREAQRASEGFQPPDEERGARAQELWPCEALAAPLLSRFRHHFCRPESELCRMDKPEWAFRYLTELAADHTAELEEWMGQPMPAGGEELMAGLCLSLACEAKRLVRARLGAMKDADSKPLLLQTLHHLVQFHGSMASLGGQAAAAAAMKDFDENRMLEGGSEEPNGPVSPERGGLALRLARLARASAEEEAKEIEPLGFLDVWAAADFGFVDEKLSAGLAGAAWRPRPLFQGTGAGPEAFGLATLLADLFERAAERASCLSSKTAQRRYCQAVLAPGLARAAQAVKQRWNELSDPLEDVQEACRLVETLQEMCIFLDSFSMAEQVETQSLDEVRELQLVILEKLAGCFQEAAKGAWRRLQKESCVFSHLFARPWQSLAEQLRGANFQALAQSIVGKLSSLLSSQLRQGRFTNEVEIELFTANVREDLQTLLQTRLSAEQLTPLQGVWEGCQLLTLPEHLAKDTLEALQKVLRLSPTREKPPEGEVLQQKQLEALRRAGVRELPVDEVLQILRKRPDLQNFSEQESSFSVLQDMLPVQATLQSLPASAAASVAQARLQDLAGAGRRTA